MLKKTPKQLAHTIEVNDLLPACEWIMDRFGSPEVPLDGAFGSTRTPDKQLDTTGSTILEDRESVKAGRSAPKR
jgi:hypothetical protein